MLLDLLKFLMRGGRKEPASGSRVPPPAEELPAERMRRIMQAHAGAPTGVHTDILFRNVSIGDHNLNDLVAQCVSQSHCPIPPLKAIHRPLASFFLAQYFLHALDIEGAQAECGVFQGTSSLLLCRTAQTRNPAYAGAGFHLIDSFEGLSESGEADGFMARGPDGGAPRHLAMPQGTFAAPIEAARSALRDFPKVAFHQGWIPDVFARLPESRWSFVHVDVDLYEPTYACLQYFYPRLSTGGVIICDDFGSVVFPGAYRAWNRFCDEREVPYVALDTGQSVILKA